MNLTFQITLKSSFRDVYLLFYSIILPVALYAGLGFYFPNAAYQAQLLAGVIGVSILFWSMVTNGFTIFQQRMQGVFKLLNITPFKTSSFIISTISAWVCISLIISIFLIISGVILFDIHLDFISLLFIMIFVILGTLMFSLIGFIIALISNDVNQVSMFSNLISLPFIFLSEAFYSMSNAPKWIQILSEINPFGYLIEGIHLSILSLYSEAMSHLIIILLMNLVILGGLLWLFRTRITV
ncbi:ABC transporter permease [Alkalihalobacillus pseudalcaliphilus]|uniref:ABC transporter permease n=1 Tax=Alkalihalobacillus pseudalcaliphilus TaxID=79884 RepID=UPI00064E00C3|nr:ABC transporter permease [Alkalihalobacillus pseudalcaliphilus]KMK77527.1 hypothetical protein AB990_03400 [Alkalihalobacillus pseudalcaliphilus]